MKERRQYERFFLTLPTRMEPIASSRKQVFDFETKDISASGAFIYTKESFPKGTRFKLNLTVPSERIKEITGANSLIESEGKIVRSTPTGVAIHFAGECQILSLKSL
jgi:hypothetical protein